MNWHLTIILKMVNDLRPLLALVILCSLSSVSTKPTLAADPPAAIIVTNGVYDNNPLPTSIPTAEADGDAFQQHLIAAGFDSARIERYKNVTSDTFKKIINDAQINYRAVTAFVFYYSGHGILYGPLPKFIPSDFSFSKLTQGKILDGMKDQTVPVEDILKIGKEGAGPALFIFDACRDEGPANLFAKLYSLEQKEATNDGRRPMMNLDTQGVFDSMKDNVVPGEFLGRFNVLALLAAVKTQWGPGISYYLNGEKLSVFTGTLLSYVDQNPNLPLAEIAVRVKPDVLTKTASARLKPPQLPYDVNDITASLRLNDFAHPPPPLDIEPAIQQYLSAISTSQLQAVANRSTFVVSAPIKLAGVSIAGLAQVPPPAVFTSPQAAPPASLTVQQPPTLQVKLTARLWNSTSDEKVYGPAGHVPAIRIPNASTKVTSLANGLTEYRHRIIADPGFRITKLDAITRAIKDVETIRTVRETDIDGITAETVLWTAAPERGSRSSDYYAADLYITERRPHGTVFFPLTGIFDLHQDRSIVLPLTPANIHQLDALQLIGMDGKLIAELQPEVAKVVKGLNWWLALRIVNEGLVLQTSGISSTQ